MCTFSTDRGPSTSDIFNSLRGDLASEDVEPCGLQSVSREQSFASSVLASYQEDDQHQDQMFPFHFDGDDDLASAESTCADTDGDDGQDVCRTKSPSLDISGSHSYVQQPERESDSELPCLWNRSISPPTASLWSNSQCLDFSQSVVQEPPPRAEELCLHQRPSAKVVSSVVAREPLKSLDLGFGPLLSTTPLRNNDRSIVDTGQSFSRGTSSLHLPHRQPTFSSKSVVSQSRAPLSSHMVQRSYREPAVEKFTSVSKEPDLFHAHPGFSHKVCVCVCEREREGERERERVCNLSKLIEACMPCYNVKMRCGCRMVIIA